MTYQRLLDDEIIVDNFAGGGGASLGIEMALNWPVDIAINHDADAIGMHEANHPMTRHYCESVWDVDPVKVCNGRKVGLAWVAVRWAGTVKPRIIILENVEEFVTWGPLRQMRDQDGTPLFHPDGRKMMEPCPLRRGMTFKSFVRALKKRGYVVEWREMRACDYGAPTIRKRLFMIARCDNQPIIWPKPTHGKVGTGLLPYRTAAECIDWSIHGKSIFERERPLKDNTMRRIAKGIKRFVIDAATPFIVTLNHSGEGFRGNAIDEPFKTMTAARDAHALVTPFIQHVQHGSAVSGTMPADEPFRTITATPKGGGMALVSPYLTGVGGRAGQSRPRSTDEPLHTVSAGGTHHAEVRAFLIKHFGTDQDPRLEDPMHTVTTKDRFGIVTVAGELYRIVDIFMRMLVPRELYRAQSFPDTWIISHTAAGKKLTQTAQVKMCGNSVPPLMAKALAAANWSSTVFTDQAVAHG